MAGSLVRAGREKRGLERHLEDWFHAHPTLITALLLAFGFLVRLRAAWGTFLNPDEALHFLAANRPSLMAAYYASLRTAHPPLLILVLNLWRVLGTSELVLRLPSVIAGTVFCWFSFKWMTSLFGPMVGWIGLLFVTFLPPLIQLSSEVRQYALLLCFLAGTAFFLEEGLAKNSAARMLLSAVFLQLGMLTHYSALFFAGAMAAYSFFRLLSHRFSGRVFAAWAAGQAAALALFVFLYKTHVSALKGSQVEQQTMQGWLRISYFHWGHDHLPLFIFARSFGVLQFVFGQLAVGDVAGLMFLVGVVFLLRAKAMLGQTGAGPRQLAILLLLPFALNCGAAISDLYPYGGTRHSAFLAPFAIAGVSLALGKLVRQRLALGLGAAALTVAVCHLFGAPHKPYMFRADQSVTNMDRAMAAIHQQVSPATPIFIDFQTNFLLRRYLCPEPLPPFNPSVPGPRTFQCGGLRVISTQFDTSVFSAETFLRQWDQMVQVANLKPGDVVWVFQAGWDVGLARQLQANFPELSDLPTQSFGRNITLFKLTVGQPMSIRTTQAGLASFSMDSAR